MDEAAIRRGLDSLAAQDPVLARELARIGYPAPRIRPRGFATLLRTIVGQQVSVAAAAAIWNRVEARIGAPPQPAVLLDLPEEDLRACGLSRQKIRYARSLAELVAAGSLDLGALPADDETAIAVLTRVQGIGRWSAEIYLMFAEGRPDIWPAGDLAVQEGLGRMLSLPARPTEREVRALGEGWRPHRSALALFTWHAYANPAL
ncbi:DNA-3-methyladenine glycosylase [Porphyrobacter sp. GA68]|uniref:DNA-3-methyladenine glycosylase family protein n=1 Tax=Porphyrobacter sp. GA68 TaxID=2883480 RepID=UPI001D1965BB|nr:DNA-3-methyladenine glycosylase 2 family protein [Porphyrobacter sp. GA68]